MVIVGAGRMGSLHARALERSGCLELVGAVDPRRPDWPVEWSPDCPGLLRSVEAQAAIVAVPPAEHDRVASECLRGGCHVLLEKPLCPDPRDARRLASEFRSAGRVLFGGHSERFHPVFQGLRSALASGPDWTSLRTRRFGPAPRETGEGGAVLDLGIHDLDLVLRLSPELSLADVQGFPDGRVVARLAAPGRRVEIQAGYSPSRLRAWEAATSDGNWRADLLARTLAAPGGTPAPVAWTDPLQAEHEAFFRAIRDGSWWDDLQPQVRAVELAREILAALD